MGTRLWGPLHVAQLVILRLDFGHLGLYILFKNQSKKQDFSSKIHLGKVDIFETQTLLACGKLHIE